jgi:hypothetical protein
MDSNTKEQRQQRFWGRVAAAGIAADRENFFKAIVASHEGNNA